MVLRNVAPSADGLINSHRKYSTILSSLWDFYISYRAAIPDTYREVISQL